VQSPRRGRLRHHRRRRFKAFAFSGVARQIRRAMGALAVLSALGLSGAAGLNAYIPLLLVGVCGRLGVVQLAAPFDTMTHTWVLVLLGVLLVVELVVDKVPGLDHINDVVQTFVRPGAGALLFGANTGAITEIHPALALTAGLLISFGVHATKAVARPVVSASTLGLGTPVVSAAEDAASLASALFAIFLPVTVLLFFGFFVFGAYWVWSRLYAAKARRTRGG